MKKALRRRAQPHGFTVRSQRGLGIFPNKQRRGYHGALLASSTKAGFPVCCCFSFVSVFSPFGEMATISSQFHGMIPARLSCLKHARHLPGMSHLVSRIRIFIHLIKRTCNTPRTCRALCGQNCRISLYIEKAESATLSASPANLIISLAQL